MAQWGRLAVVPVGVTAERLIFIRKRSPSCLTMGVDDDVVMANLQSRCSPIPGGAASGRSTTPAGAQPRLRGCPGATRLHVQGSGVDKDTGEGEREDYLVSGKHLCSIPNGHSGIVCPMRTTRRHHAPPGRHIPRKLSRRA